MLYRTVLYYKQWVYRIMFCNARAYQGLAIFQYYFAFLFNILIRNIVLWLRYVRFNIPQCNKCNEVVVHFQPIYYSDKF